MKTIYHLAISRLKYNKGRSILTIVAIALMTTLLMSIGNRFFSSKKKSITNAGRFKPMGIDGLAVVSAIIAQSDIKAAAAELKDLFCGKEKKNGF